MTETTETQSVRYQCRHIHTDGRRCGSPSLRHQHFCYYHHTTRKPIAQSELARRRESISNHEARQQTFDLPLPEDRAAIQYSIGEVLRRIASNEIDPRRAGLLLYGLQIAALNLPPQPRATEAPTLTQEYVEEVIADETYGDLAPIAEIQPKKAPKTLSEILNEQWEKDKEEERLAAERSGSPMITTPTNEESEEWLSWGQSLPTIQAVSTPLIPTPKNPTAPLHPGPTSPFPRKKSLDTKPTSLYGLINYPKIDLARSLTTSAPTAPHSM